MIHQLDLTACLPGSRLAPAGESTAIAVRTVDELTGGSARPPGWDEAGYVLKATGRFPLDAGERALLGERAAAFPAFG